MEQKRLRLLFITPKINEQDDNLAFASLWAQAFQDAGFDVTVIAGNVGSHALSMPVHNVGHERGSRWNTFWKFQKLIRTLRYDRVFVHMNTRWLAAGAWYWKLKGIPVYLWFTHNTRALSFRVGESAVTRMFTAGKDSLPHFAHDPRKVVTGHGIDTRFWNVPELPDAQRESKEHMLCVHRMSRSKRFDIVLKALALLPPEYRVTHVGAPLDPSRDPSYAAEITQLVNDLHLQDRVTFMGARPMPELRAIYPRFRVFVNLAAHNLDKTPLEAMACGLTPVISRELADAIGYPDAPEDVSPQAVADFMKTMALKPHDELRQIVQEKHSLASLIQKMSVYIVPGN